MSKSISILLVIIFISGISFSQSIWIRTGGPGGGPVYSVVETNSSTIYIGTNGGVYKSVNSGSLFSPIGLYINPEIIQMVTLNKRIFATDGNYLLFKSSNEGMNWINIASDKSGLMVFNNILFAMSGFNGCYKSTDYGDTWTLMNNGLPVQMDLRLSGFGNYLYGYRSYVSNVIYRSADNGDSWSVLNCDLPAFEGVNSLGAFNNYLFINLATSTGSMIYKSTNSGINWTKINNWDPTSYVNSFVQSGVYIMASINGKGVLRSKDAGTNWIPSNNGLSNLNSISLTKGTNKVYASIANNFSTGALFQSANNGSTWTELKNGLTTGNVLDMVMMNNNILAATSSGLYKSNNKGANWSLSNTGLTSSSVSVLARKDNTSIVYAGTNDSGIYVSNNFGTTWTHTVFNTGNVLSVSVSGSNIYAGVSNYGVYASSDNGKTWVLTSEISTRVISLASKGKRVYAGWRNSHGKPHGGIDFSNDNGNTWTASDIPDNPVSSIGIFDNNNVIAASGSGVFLSTNFGMNWNIINSAVDITGDNYDLVTMSYGDVYVANSNGVAGSYDYGKTWELVSYGLLSKNCRVITGDLNNLYVAPKDFGVWKLTLSKSNLSSTLTKTEDSNLPIEFKLHQNYPNPFNPVTNIKFDLPESGNVKLSIYNSLGNEVDVLVNENLVSGYYVYQWNSQKFSSGIYFCRIQTGKKTSTLKMLLVK